MVFEFIFQSLLNDNQNSLKTQISVLRLYSAEEKLCTQVSKLQRNKDEF